MRYVQYAKVQRSENEVNGSSLCYFSGALLHVHLLCFLKHDSSRTYIVSNLKERHGNSYSVACSDRSAESNLHTKVAELQEDISLKRFDLGVAQLRLAAVQAQVCVHFLFCFY